uniref:Predicted gene 13090 n=1 Tax=Mus spicilegus TaxID=10103 RepID=A0A8C6MUN1_MUSSI
ILTPQAQLHSEHPAIQVTEKPGKGRSAGVPCHPHGNPRLYTRGRPFPSLEVTSTNIVNRNKRAHSSETGALPPSLSNLIRPSWRISSEDYAPLWTEQPRGAAPRETKSQRL